MNRNTLSVVSVLALSGLLGGALSAAADRSNILVIMADDVG